MKALLFLVVSLAGAAATVHAQDEVAAARERISAGRNAAEAQFTIEEKACYQRFAVNDCLQAARNKRRAALAELRREEIAINDAERQRKSAERLQSLEERAADRARSQDAGKAAEAAARQQEREAAAAQRQAARPASPAPGAAPPATDGVGPVVPGRTAPAAAGPVSPAVPAARAAPGRPSVPSAPSAPAPVARPADTEAQVLRYQKRLEEAQARKDRVERKLSERTKAPAAPLPTPSP